MGYEIYISPNDDKKSISLDSVVHALTAAGLVAATLRRDQIGHWLTFGGYGSALNLDVENGFVRGGGMKLDQSDNPLLLEKIVEVFHSLNWSVGDDEGELE